MGRVYGIYWNHSVAYNIVEKIEFLKPRSFRMYPLQGLLYLVYSLVFLTANVYAVVKLEEWGEWRNKKLKEAPKQKKQTQ